MFLGTKTFSWSYIGIMTQQTIPRHWTIVLAAAFLGLAACHEIMDQTPPDMQNMKESRPLGKAKELEVKLRYDVGVLEVRGDKGQDLFSFNLDYDANRSTPKFDFNESGERATLDLRIDHRSGFNNTKRGNDLSLHLTDSVPLDLDFTAGVADSHMDMTDLDIRRFHLSGGVGRTDVTFDHPLDQPMTYFEVESGVGNLTIRGLGNTRVERMKVDGGVGRTDLDFTGDLKDGRIDTEINVGVGQVRLLMPRNANVTIEAEGSFLSNLSAPGFQKDGHTYTHKGDEASPPLTIRVRSGVGGVTVELI
jgi:hypothetical protein